tara:strand:+ start:521 stop:1018 length:498 start_codon:yes stop_codon:yes gene_type:complete
MKKIIILILILSANLTLSAQIKLGYIDSQELLSSMPEAKKAETELVDFTKSLESQLEAMEAEATTIQVEYKNNETSYTDLEKKDKEAEYMALMQRIQVFQQNAEQALQKKQQEIMEPIITKARKAIEDVFNEEGFTYIFDKSSGSILFAKETEDIMPLVKKKLGI